eukprot:scaffold63871_cov36-Phaeocystis_antarctica.AAC.2
MSRKPYFRRFLGQKRSKNALLEGRAARRRERSLGRIGTILGSTDMSTTRLTRIISVAEVHVCSNLELLACQTCRGHIRRARDRPNPPKGAFTAPRGALSNLRPNGPKSTAYSHAPSRSDSARAGWRAAVCRGEKPFPEPCLCHTFRFPENAEAVRANECPSRRRKTQSVSERRYAPIFAAWVFATFKLVF